MKKVVVDKDTCIRCGACVGICPEVYTFTDDDDVEAKESNNHLDTMSEEIKEAAIEALHGCPVDAIHEVEE